MTRLLKQVRVMLFEAYFEAPVIFFIMVPQYCTVNADVHAQRPWDVPWSHAPFSPSLTANPLTWRGEDWGHPRKVPKVGKQDLGCPGKLTNHDATFDDQS